jgi:hypothetical protein
VFGGLLVLLILIKLLMLALPGMADAIGSYNGRIGILFYLFGYWQAYHRPYKAAGILWRYGALVMLNIFILLMVVIIVLFGTVATHPELFRANSAAHPAADTVAH